MCFKGNFAHMSLIYLPLTHQNVISKSYYLMCKRPHSPFPEPFVLWALCFIWSTRKPRFGLGDRLMKAPLCVSDTFSWKVSPVFWGLFLCLSSLSFSLVTLSVPNYISLCLNITILIFLCLSLEFSKNGLPCNCLDDLLMKLLLLFFKLQPNFRFQSGQ